MGVVLEPKFDNQQALPYGEELAPKEHRDFLQYLRTPKVSSGRSSDGFLTFSGLRGMWDCGRDGHRWSNTMEKFCLECSVDQ